MHGVKLKISMIKKYDLKNFVKAVVIALFVSCYEIENLVGPYLLFSSW